MKAWRVSATVQSAGAKPALILSDGFPPLLDTVGTPPAQSNWDVWDQHFPEPKVYQWNATVQRELTWGSTIEVAYVGRAAYFLTRDRNLNSLPPGTVQANPGVSADALKGCDRVIQGGALDVSKNDLDPLASQGPSCRKAYAARTTCDHRYFACKILHCASLSDRLVISATVRSHLRQRRNRPLVESLPHELVSPRSATRAWSTPIRDAHASSPRTAVQLQQLLAQTKVLRNQ